MEIPQKVNDPFGAAVAEFSRKGVFAKKYIKVHSSVAGDEHINVPYLFRSYKKMPELERLALAECIGKILDVGACAGSHSLHLQNKGLDVTALEISELCCSVMKSRDIKKIVCSDIFKYNNETFDTILFMMNGIGIAGTLDGLKKLLRHLKILLHKGGKILFDSSDIEYCYFEEDGSKWIDLNNEYYGQVRYTLQYKETKGEPFDWLFVDAETMEQIASEEGFEFKVLAHGNHYDYLGELRVL